MSAVPSVSVKKNKKNKNKTKTTAPTKLTAPLTKLLKKKGQGEIPVPLKTSVCEANQLLCRLILDVCSSRARESNSY